MTLLHVGRIVLLLFWASFFIYLLSFGRGALAKLLHPGLWWLVGWGGVILLLFLFVSLAGKAKQARKFPYMELTSQLVLLIPILFFIQFRTASFNESTFINRTVSSDAIFRMQAFQEEVARDMAEANGQGETPLTNLYFQADKFIGKEVAVVCQAFVSENLPEQRMMCYRYLITCCAADAQPIFVFVNTEKIDEVDGERWVKIKGLVEYGGEEGKQVATINADSLEYVKEPAFPYAY